MSRGVNKVIIIGNTGGDVDTRVLPSGALVANFSVATGDSWRDKGTGERQERTEWHKVTAFGALAEIAQKYLKKGDQVYVEGSLRTSKWQDKNGQDRYRTEIVAKEINSLWGSFGPQGGAKPPGGVEAGLDDDIPW